MLSICTYKHTACNCRNIHTEKAYDCTKKKKKKRRSKSRGTELNTEPFLFPGNWEPGPGRVSPSPSDTWCRCGAGPAEPTVAAEPKAIAAERGQPLPGTVAVREEPPSSPIPKEPQCLPLSPSCAAPPPLPPRPAAPAPSSPPGCAGRAPRCTAS